MKKEEGIDLKASHRLFFNLVQGCDREELARCIRLLSMYLAMYKRRCGEISISDYLELSESPVMNQDMADLFKDGLDEASAMLSLVIQDQEGSGEPVQIPAMLN
jgi:hypothetical protein